MDAYFDEGYFGKEWYGQGGLRSRLGGNHRTLQSYVTAIRQAGFIITDLREPRPSAYALRTNKENCLADAHSIDVGVGGVASVTRGER